MKRTILTTAAFAAVVLLVPVANAVTYYFYVDGAGTPANYNDANYWWSTGCGTGTNGTLPTVSDHAVICSGEVCNVTASASVETVNVLGTLNIQASQTLSLGSGTSGVDGTINLLGSGSTLSFTSSHIVVGGGSIDGQNDSAVIEIADDETLTNAATIEGNCQIMPVPGGDEDPTFVNNGTVHANNAGTLYVAPHSIGASSGIWQVSSSSSAVLQIGVATVGTHTGSINVSNGTLDIDESFETEGQLTLTGGTIDVASTKTFEAS